MAALGAGLEDRTPQVVHLPHFVSYTTDVASLLNECRFPHLLELNLGWGWTFEMYQYAQPFPEAHPTIENLTWSCTYNVVLRQGSLPNLKHLSLSHLSFVRVLSTARGPPPSPSPDSTSEGTGTYAPPQPQPKGKLTLETLGDLFLFSTTSRRRCRTLMGRLSGSSRSSFATASRHAPSHISNLRHPKRTTQLSQLGHADSVGATSRDGVKTRLLLLVIIYNTIAVISFT